MEVQSQTWVSGLVTMWAERTSLSWKSGKTRTRFGYVCGGSHSERSWIQESKTLVRWLHSRQCSNRLVMSALSTILKGAAKSWLALVWAVSYRPPFNHFII